MITVRTVVLHGLTGHLLWLTATQADAPRPTLNITGRARSDGGE